MNPLPCLFLALLLSLPARSEPLLAGQQLPLNQVAQQRLLQNLKTWESPQTETAPDGKNRPLTAQELRRSVARAVAFLQRCQQEDGSVSEGIVHYSEGAATVMTALAMLAAGADPVSDVSLGRALDWLKQHPQENTYFRAVRANVWQYALRRSPDDPDLKAALEEDYAWLIKALAQKEGWRYQMNSHDWDNSVTQYGVLGVWAAKRAGLDPGAAFWQKMSEHFRGCQNPDGGWGYQRSGSSANMATAGLATLFLVFDNHHGRQYYQRAKGNPFAEGDAAECLAAIDRAMAWLGTHGGDNLDGYYLYGIERTGVASGRKTIGGRDWFREGATTILQAQRADGAIPLRGYGKERINSAFATLFMVYGGAPVAFNKLEYGEGQGWNLNPRDVANLTKHLWAAYEQPLNWFSVNINAPVEEFEAPILFISGAEAVRFTDSQVDTLRQYVERGGMIFAEPADHSPEFRASMAALVEQLYPAERYALRGLHPLDPAHPVYSVLNQGWSHKPVLQGAHIGSRVFFVLSDGYLAKDWQMNHTDTDAFRLAMNLLFYATDRGSLYPRLQSHLPETAAAPATGRSLRVARLWHVDARVPLGDWDYGAEWVRAFAPFFSHVHGAALEERASVDLDDALPGDVDLLLLTGRGDLHLDARDADKLRAWMNAGGTLLVDAWGGDEVFATSVRAWAEKNIGPLQPLPASHAIAVGRFAGGFDLRAGMRYTLPARQALRAQDATVSTHQLEAVMVNDRPVLVFARHGLTGPLTGVREFGAATYQPGSARKVLANLCGYLLQRGT